MEKRGATRSKGFFLLRRFFFYCAIAFRALPFSLRQEDITGKGLRAGRFGTGSHRLKQPAPSGLLFFKLLPFPQCRSPSPFLRSEEGFNDLARAGDFGRGTRGASLKILRKRHSPGRAAQAARPSSSRCRSRPFLLLRSGPRERRGWVAKGKRGKWKAGDVKTKKQGALAAPCCHPLFFALPFFLSPRTRQGQEGGRLCLSSPK